MKIHVQNSVGFCTNAFLDPVQNFSAEYIMPISTKKYRILLKNIMAEYFLKTLARIDNLRVFFKSFCRKCFCHGFLKNFCRKCFCHVFFKNFCRKSFCGGIKVAERSKAPVKTGAGSNLSRSK